MEADFKAQIEWEKKMKAELKSLRNILTAARNSHPEHIDACIDCGAIRRAIAEHDKQFSKKDSQ